MKRSEEIIDVVVLGGGIIGCAIAYFLRKAHVSVMVLEQGDIGAQASSVAAGLLAPLGPLSGPGSFADLLLASFACFPALVPELEDASGLRVGYEQTGALRTVRNSKRVAHLQKRMESWRPLGLKMYWLNGEEARKQEPTLSPDICAAVYAPEESQLSSADLTRAFARAAKQNGTMIYSQSTVRHISSKNSRVVSIYTGDGKEISCSYLVIATGAWSAQSGQWFQVSLPVRPVRGQMLAYRQPPMPLRHIVFGEGAYLVPRGADVLVGATKEDVGFDKQITEEGRAWLRESACKLLPSLHDGQVERFWAGLRPGTPDTRPILGPMPGWENVLLATGHNSVGIILSPITGQAIAESVVTGQVPKIIRPFSLSRFL